MRRDHAVVAMAVLLTLFHHQQTLAAPSSSSAYHIIPSRPSASAGERIQFRLEPPAPHDAQVNWDVWLGSSGLGLVDATYRAPFLIPPGTRPARVSVAISGPSVKFTLDTYVELIPGTAPGAEDCFAPSQPFSTVYGGFTGEFIPFDEPPQLITRVDPVYPRSSFVRGSEDKIPLHVLVCRTGRVLDAYALESFRNIGDLKPIERDPKLVAAALDAVRQYVFKPATAAGVPIAVWIEETVSFSR